jgi:predicted transcriptional regulator
MPSTNPKESSIIRDPDQVRALSSPIRNAIHQVIINQGETSIREIGEQLGREPASLYRHVDLLIGTGLIKEVGSRTTTRRDAKLYASDLEYIAYMPEDAEMIDAVSHFAKTVTRRAGTGVANSLQSKNARTKSWDSKRDTYVGTEFGWLHPEDLKQVNQHLNAIIDLFHRKAREPDAELVSITMAMSPLPISVTDS